jgi:hypothetical protein
MADRSRAIDEFMGDLAADLLAASGRAVKQAGKAYKKGTAFTLRYGLSGTADGEIAEDSTRSSGLSAKLTPGPVVAAKVGGEVTGSMGRTSQMVVAATGGFHWWIECEVQNAVALETDVTP